MKIYKKDTKGKIRSLEIQAVDGHIIQISGLLDGKKVTHDKLCKPKNVGKSNETDAQSQAELQKSSLITKKIREGYFYYIEEATNTKVIKPMLAKDYFKELHKLKLLNTIALQPKLDGVRCIVHYDASTKTIKAFTRQNKLIENIQPILDELLEYLEDSEDVIFDGELYIHGYTFQQVTKVIKNPWNSDPTSNIATPRYSIYDIVEEGVAFEQRYRNLYHSIYDEMGFLHLDIVETLFVDNTAEEIKAQYSDYIEEGYEGMMIRVMSSEYKIGGRSSDLLKYKEFITVTSIIHAITPNDANPNHGTVWTLFEGNVQKSGAKLSHEDREEILRNKHDYVGRMGEFRYFEKTDDGLMRFPVFLGLREDQ